MIRIGFAGVPGAGKTSTARALAAECRGSDTFKNVELVSEYARRYISKYGKIEEIWEQFRILQKQLDWEDTCGDVDLLITDGPVFQGLMYAQMMKDRKSRKEVMLINDLMSELNKLNNPAPRYDVIFHLPPTVDPVSDGIRSAEQFDPSWRTNANAELMNVFGCFKPGLFYTVRSLSMDKRVKECMEVLQGITSFVPAPNLPLPRTLKTGIQIAIAKDKDGKEIFVDTLIRRNVSEIEADACLYGRAQKEFGGILKVELTDYSGRFQGMQQADWPLTEVEVYTPELYVECMGVVHKADVDGDATCGHGRGISAIKKPQGKDCPICFGGGGA